MRGRRPGVRRLQLLEGDPGKHAPKNTPHPRRSLTAPKAPPYLSAIARATWNLLAPGLAEQGLLADQDVDAFAAYCEAKSSWVKAMRSRARLKSDVMKTPNGGLQQHPLVGMVNRAELAMFRRGEQFGLTGPMTRQRMNLPEPDDGDEDDGLAKRRA